MSDAFNCSIPFAQQRALSAFVGSLTNAPQDIRNLAGRLNYFAAKAQVVPTPTNPPSVGVVPIAWFPSPSGQVNVCIAEVAGRASITDGSGNAPDALSLDPTFPDNQSITAWGSGSASGIPVVAGQPFYFKQESGSVKDMRAQIQIDARSNAPVVKQPTPLP